MGGGGGGSDAIIHVGNEVAVFAGEAIGTVIRRFRLMHTRYGREIQPVYISFPSFFFCFLSRDDDIRRIDIRVHPRINVNEL